MHGYTYVTGFAKGGLPPHTSNSTSLKDFNLDLKVHTNLNFHGLLIYVSPHYHPNFKTIGVFNLNLWIAKVGKLDVTPFRTYIPSRDRAVLAWQARHKNFAHMIAPLSLSFIHFKFSHSLIHLQCSLSLSLTHTHTHTWYLVAAHCIV